MDEWNLDNVKICVIGLGYVGLPLAVAFGEHYPTLGFDLNSARIAELRSGRDSTLEVEPEELAAAGLLSFTDKIEDALQANIYIVAVPTPIDAAKRPDLTPLRDASTTVGKVLKNGDIVIYESTVFPGATEEVCVPILEEVSGLFYNRDFFCGYSPERINPGDKEHRIASIVKVTSGSTGKIADYVDALYATIITAGTFKASSIKVAEAAKVIENTQRDVNIALVNELALIFNKLEINTAEVLDAASTKWNFLPFRPGLVGGHCIGVDPYYLTHKAQEMGYHPNMILAGRRLNDEMGRYIASAVIKLMTKRRIDTGHARILIMGLSFKENCPDLRNTRVIDIIAELEDYGVSIDIYDPWVSKQEAEKEYGYSLLEKIEPGLYDGIILAVAHRQFLEMGVAQVRSFGKKDCVLYDVKGVFPREQVEGSL